MYFRFGRPPSWVPTASNMGQVQITTNEKPVVENIGFGFGMVLLSRVQTEIYVFPVWAANILCSDLW